MPSTSDVHRTFLHEDCFAQSVALSLDLKAAHKCVKVEDSDQGTLLFQHRGKSTQCVTLEHGFLLIDGNAPAA